MESLPLASAWSPASQGYSLYSDKRSLFSLSFPLLAPSLVLCFTDNFGSSTSAAAIWLLNSA